MLRRKLKIFIVIFILGFLGFMTLRPKITTHYDIKNKMSGTWIETTAGMLSAIDDKQSGMTYLGGYIGSDRTCCHFAIGHDRRKGLIFQLANPANGSILFSF